MIEAVIVVIDAPVYNYSIHSNLKAYFDQIARAGLTFSYSSNGPVGLLTGKKVYVAVASGGVYSEGPNKSNDFVAPYLKTFLSFLGMDNVTLVRAEGLAVAGVQETALQKGIESIVIS